MEAVEAADRPETEFFYDVRPPEERYGTDGFLIEETAGRLIVGREAANELLNDYGPEAIRSLPELITSQEFPYEKGAFGNVKVEGWQKDDYRMFGEWVVNVVHTQEPDYQGTLLTKLQLAHLNILQLCPSPASFNMSYGPLWQLRQDVGVGGGYERGRYETWTEADFILHAYNLSARLGRKPNEQDYRAADGPNQYVLERRVGGIRALNEKIGYPNIHEWQQEDFIEWGLRVKDANPDTPLAQRLVNTLAARSVGPGRETIVQHFNGWNAYIGEVEKAQEVRDHQRALVRAERVEAYGALQKQGILPPGIEERNETEKADFVVKYQLAKACLPDHSSFTHVVLGFSPAGEFIKQARSYARSLAALVIESKAESLNVKSEIWPSEPWRDYLAVVPKES